MKYTMKNVCVLWLITMTWCQAHVYAQSVPGVPNPSCAYCGASLPNGVHSASCPYYRTGGHGRGPHVMDMNTMVTLTLFESLLTSLFADNTASEKEAAAAREKAAALAAQQAAELQQAQAAAAQAEYERMMRLYKPLNNSQGVAFKTLSNSALTFKPLGSDETLAANARKPFDTAGDQNLPAVPVTGDATPFFGDTMPAPDLQCLINPENDPMVVDLRQAVTFVAENIKNDSEKLEAATKPTKDRSSREKPTQRDLDCDRLRARLTSQINQRARFQKTIDLSQSQLTTWETANRNALLNAAKDGLEVFTGKLLDKFTKRCQAADRLQRILEKNSGKMAQQGLDIAQIQAKIDRLRILASAGRIVELKSSVDDWQTFIKDGVSGLVSQLTASNDEIQAMLEDPMMQEYFEQESPELKALLDISTIAASSKVFGKWVAKKMPIVAGVELASSVLYNGTDWLLSYHRIKEANQINGRVMAAARGLQQDIDDTYRLLGDCP